MFKPSCTLIIATNGLPVLKRVDNAIRRRVVVAPFTRVLGQDSGYEGTHARAELPGILQWAIDGHALYRTHGLAPRGRWKEATDAYLCGG